jgi:LPS export ABC transporter protein LptC
LKAPWRRRIILGLALVLVVSAASLTAVFYFYRQTGPAPEQLLEAIPEGASIAIGRVEQTSVRDGVKEWTLEADAVRYDAEGQKAVFENIRVVFFPREGGEVHLRAREGVLHTRLQNMDLKGDIHIQQDDTHMWTEVLHFDNAARRLTGPTAVRITGQGFELAGEAITIELETRRAVLQGAVKGSFSDSLAATPF